MMMMEKKGSFVCCVIAKPRFRFFFIGRVRWLLGGDVGDVWMCVDVWIGKGWGAEAGGGKEGVDGEGRVVVVMLVGPGRSCGYFSGSLGVVER